MPRDNVCLSCHGMFHDDQMSADDPMQCVYCARGVDSDVTGQVREREAADGEG